MNPLNQPASRLLNRVLVTAALWLGWVTASPAHPGHSPLESTPAHLLTSPYHLTMLVFAGAAMFVAGRFVRRSLPRRALQCGGAATLLLAVVLFGLRT